MIRAVYPGTFDPMTNGHLDLMKRSAKLCDELYMAIATNERKGPLFSAEERKELVERAIREVNIQAKVVIFDNLLVDLVHDLDATMVIRGVRAFSDFEYEFQMALVNRRMSQEFETVFLMPHESYSYVSSRMVKEVVKLGGSTNGMVPAYVEQALKERFQGES